MSPQDIEKAKARRAQIIIYVVMGVFILLPLVLYRMLGLKTASSPAMAAPPPAHTPTLVLLDQQPAPVITIDSPDSAGNRHGFEGGNVVKVGGTYHLVTTEMAGDPRAVRTRLAHWQSEDRVHWIRVATLFQGSGDFTGRDPRAALWGPMFVYDPEDSAWSLFYVAYRAEPNTEEQFRINFDGVIWRAVSRIKGPAGINGPYEDTGIVLQPGRDSQPWEGLQGTDSFFPYRAGNRWLGFYGSANTEHKPVKYWRAGLAEADRLAGPWQRCLGVNPIEMDPRFVENPVVTRMEDGSYIAVYDNEHPNAIGYACSPNGVDWQPGRDLVVQPKGKGFWADHVRTPLGLVPEGEGRYTLFYTGYQGGSGENSRSSVGFVTVALRAGGSPGSPSN